MTDGGDWRFASWEGHRLRQHREFQALAFREKLAIIEHLGEVAAFFAERRRGRGLPVRSRPPEGAAGGERGAA